MVTPTDSGAGQVHMLAEERRRLILDRVAQQGSVRVAQLARELAVTEETIRRDLERLGAEGLLVRTHGGAVPNATDRTELPFGVRETVRLKEKRLIARRAATHVGDGDIVALDASSTAYEMARCLPDVSLTVVTNSMAVATVLADRPAIRVVCTGGVLDAPSLSFVGSLAEESLGRFNIRKLFFSCQGVDFERGLSVTADEHGRIKRRMLDLAETAYLLVDSSKFNVRAIEFFAPVNAARTLITDADADEQTRGQFAELGIAVEVA